MSLSEKEEIIFYCYLFTVMNMELEVIVVVLSYCSCTY